MCEATCNAIERNSLRVFIGVFEAANRIPWMRGRCVTDGVEKENWKLSKVEDRIMNCGVCVDVEFSGKDVICSGCAWGV